MKGGNMKSALQKEVISKEAVNVLYCEQCDKLVRMEDADQCPPLYECSNDNCGTTFVGTEGRNCTECNRPFSRKLADHACEDCEGEMEETTAFECGNDGCSQHGLHLIEEEAKGCKVGKTLIIPAHVISEDQGSLTSAEEKRKKELVKVVKDGLNKFIEVGMALVELRDKKLYRNTHETFERFVNDSFSIGIRYAQMLMKGTKTVENLKTRTQVRLPESERQVRPLSEFDNDPDTQAKLWKRAVQKADGGSPSPALVRDTVEDYFVEEHISLPPEEEELQERKFLGEEIGAPLPPIRTSEESGNLKSLKLYWDRTNKTDRGKFCLWAGLRIA
jgi:hypothetical protein